MKPSILTKDVNFSLHNIDNFKKDLDSNLSEIINIYFHLIVEYFKFIVENIKIKNKVYSRFIIIRGLDTITNVFLNLLNYTKNIELTFFHCQKSFYFYVEFIGQITEDEKMFLQLSSRDASTYVYKKTVFDINNECRKIQDICSSETSEKFNVLNVYINIYKTIMYNIIQNEDLNVGNMNIEYFEKLHNKLYEYNFNKENLSSICFLIEKLHHKLDKPDFFIESILILIKKISKKPTLIQKCKTKLLIQEAEYCLNDTPEEFILSLIS